MKSLFQCPNYIKGPINLPNEFDSFNYVLKNKLRISDDITRIMYIFAMLIDIKGCYQILAFCFFTNRG